VCGEGRWRKRETVFEEAETLLCWKNELKKMRNECVLLSEIKLIEKVFPRVHRKMTEPSTTSFTEHNVSYLCYSCWLLYFDFFLPTFTAHCPYCSVWLWRIHFRQN